MNVNPLSSHRISAEGGGFFFGRNDCYPFQRSELHQFDPQLEEVLERRWFRLE